MSTSFSFKNNLTIDNNKYLNWLNSTGTTRSNIIAVDAGNHVNLNAAQGDIFINSANTASSTFLNVGNNSNVYIASKLGVGFSSVDNVQATVAVATNGYIGTNTTTGANNGFLGLTASHRLSQSSGSYMLLYGNDTSTHGGKLQLFGGHTTSGSIELFTGPNSKKFQITPLGSAQFSPNGSTIRVHIQDAETSVTNQVILYDTTPSTNSSTGALVVAGGIGVQGNCFIDGTLSINSMSGNINFDSSQASHSYTTGAIYISGGLGISNTEDAVSISSGGGISVAGGVAIGKKLFVGGQVTLEDTTVPTSAQTGTLVVRGGMGINNAVYIRSNNASQMRLAPVSDGSQTSIAFHATNDFQTSNTGANASWIVGNNVGSVGSGNFGLFTLQSGTALCATYTGFIGISNTSPTTTLDVGGTIAIRSTSDFAAMSVSGGATFVKNVVVNGPSLLIPRGATGARPSPATRGSIRYNTDSDQFEGFGGGDTWGTLGGVIDVNQDTKILAEESPGANDDNLRFFTANVERMRINSAGNIGIGTSTPTYVLDIVGRYTGDGIRVTNATHATVSLQSGSASVLQLFQNTTQMGMSTNATYGPIVVSQPNGFTTFDTNGNVGIGNSTPSFKLHVSGSFRASTAQFDTSPFALSVGANSTSSPVSSIVRNASGELEFAVANTSGQFSASAISGDCVIRTGTSTKLLLQSGTGNAGLCFTSSGNIGVQTSSPAYTFSVNGTVSATTITCGTISAPNGNYTTLTAGSLTSASATFGNVLVSTTTQLLGTSTIGSIITTGGNVGIQNSAPAYALDVSGTARCTTALVSNMSAGTVVLTNSTNATGLGTGGSLTVLGGGAISKDLYVGGAVVSSSDIRLKTDIQPLSSHVDILELINDIRTVKFKYTNDYDLPTQIGFIAQDFVSSFPELVRTSDTGMLALDYPKITVVLMECIKSLKQELDNLKKRL